MLSQLNGRHYLSCVPKLLKITAGNVNEFNHVTELWLSSKDNGFGFVCFIFSNVMFSIKDLL